MHTREASLSDIKDIVEIEKLAWPEGGAANEEQFKSRIETFKKGVIVAEDNGQIVGVVVGQLIFFDELYNSDNKNWSNITDNGYIKNSHEKNGDSLFGVDLSVRPDYQKKGVGKKLLLEIGRLAVRNNLKCGLLGARMPDFHKYKNEITPGEYLSYRKDGKLIDSELRFYERNGLKLIKLLPEYFPDPDSLNYGVLALWKNPFYIRNKLLGKITGYFFSLLFKI